MRIRKRQVPLPLSSLSPIPLSDPILFVFPPPNSKPSPSPIDSRPPNPSIAASVDDSPLFHGNDRVPKATEYELAADYFPDEEKGSTYHSSTYHSRGPDNGEEKASSGSKPAAIPRAASSSQEAVKKRLLSSNEDGDDKDYKWDVKMKGCLGNNNGGRRRGRGEGGGGVDGEGSRCSRVNGRGWRCGQQTLVGYSLCEHHLGKGRLRSMANVRGRSPIGVMEISGNGNEKSQQVTTHQSLEPSLFPGPRDNEEEEDNEKDDLVTIGPRKKARSMSSLLGQGPDYDHDHDHGASISVTCVVEGD